MSGVRPDVFGAREKTQVSAPKLIHQRAFGGDDNAFRSGGLPVAAGVLG